MPQPRRGVRKHVVGDARTIALPGPSVPDETSTSDVPDDVRPTVKKGDIPNSPNTGDKICPGCGQNVGYNYKRFTYHSHQYPGTTRLCRIWDEK